MTGRPPRQFGPDQLEKLAAHAIGRQRRASADGVEAGWIAGDHILDTKFDLAKNIVNDTLQFALRVDSQKVPADLFRAIHRRSSWRVWPRATRAAIQRTRQRREAREYARNAWSTRPPMAAISAQGILGLWDAQSNELLVGTTAATAHRPVAYAVSGDLQPQVRAV